MTPSPGDAIGAGAIVPLAAPAPRPTGRPALPAPGRPGSEWSWSADGIEEVPTTAGGAVPAELTDRFGRGRTPGATGDGRAAPPGKESF